MDELRIRNGSVQFIENGGPGTIASGESSALHSMPLLTLFLMKSDLAPEHGPARAVNGVTRRLADTGAAARSLGFRAEIDLRQGLQGLVEWWRASR